jgi:hypothetical protein
MTPQPDDRLTTNGQAPQLTFSEQAWSAIVAWTQATPWEVGGLGIIEANATGYLVTDAFAVNQSANTVTTTLDATAVASLVGDLLDQGADPAALRVWWHSHAGEPPFWSGDDERTIASFRPAAMISLVTDHRLRVLARIDRFDPRETIPLRVERPSTLPSPQERRQAAVHLRENVVGLDGSTPIPTLEQPA